MLRAEADGKADDAGAGQDGRNIDSDLSQVSIKTSNEPDKTRRQWSTATLIKRPALSSWRLPAVPSAAARRPDEERFQPVEARRAAI